MWLPPGAAAILVGFPDREGLPHVGVFSPYHELQYHFHMSGVEWLHYPVSGGDADEWLHR